jgi:hypothetical protein
MIIRNYIKSENNSSQKDGTKDSTLKFPLRSKKNLSIDVLKNPIFQLKTSITPVANLIPMKPNIIKAFEEFKEEVIINPQVPSEYLYDIYKGLLSEENENEKVLDYLTMQSEINEKMRGILFDWLIEVHHKFQLQDETMFITIRLIDSYLSKALIHRSKLQLLGIACLQIACKFEEILVPCIQDLVFVTDNAYSQDEVFQMEVDVLKKLEYKLVNPSSFRFLEIIAEHFGFAQKHLNFGKYLLFLTTINYELIKYCPSVIACSTAYIIMKFFKYPNYTEIYDGWNLNADYDTLKECAREICVMVDNLDKYHTRATSKKFSSSKYDQVSLISFG